jgi:hypothetical protein
LAFGIFFGPFHAGDRSRVADRIKSKGRATLMKAMFLNGFIERGHLAWFGIWEFVPTEMGNAANTGGIFFQSWVGRGARIGTALPGD